MERNRGGRPRHPDVLTPAEWRVLEALREGGTNAEIAARLGVSANTVRYHVSNMLAKLELRDRRALAAWRPEPRRRRLGALFALPAALWSVGRPLAWVGVGAAALAGVAVVVVALVAPRASWRAMAIHPPPSRRRLRLQRPPLPRRRRQRPRLPRLSNPRRRRSRAPCLPRPLHLRRLPPRRRRPNRRRPERPLP